MNPDPIESRRRDHRTQPRDEVERLKYDGSGTVFPGPRTALSLDGTILTEGKSALRYGRPCPIAAEPLKTRLVATIKGDSSVHVDASDDGSRLGRLTNQEQPSRWHASAARSDKATSTAVSNQRTPERSLISSRSPRYYLRGCDRMPFYQYVRGHLVGYFLRPAAWGLGAMGLLVSGCWDVEQCFEEHSVGDKLSFSLGEQFGSASDSAVTWEPETCNELYGIGPGTTFTLEIENFSGDKICGSAVGKIEGLPGFDLELFDPDRRVDGGYLASGNYLYSFGEKGCTGNLQFNADTSEIPAASWTREGKPEAWVIMSFRPDQNQAGCTTACENCLVGCSVKFSTSIALE